MFEHHVKACAMNEAEEVFEVVFPASDESAEVVHACEERFHFPRLRYLRSLRPSGVFCRRPRRLGAIISIEIPASFPVFAAKAKPKRFPVFIWGFPLLRPNLKRRLERGFPPLA